MPEEMDEIDESLRAKVTLVATAAATVGERLARQRAEQRRAAAAADQREAAELASRLEVERATARAEYGPTTNPRWWDRATPEQIGSAYESAIAWSRDDPDAHRAATLMGQQLRDRYDVDVVVTPAPDVAAAVTAAERDASASHATASHERAAAAREQGEAAGLVAGADAMDQEARDARAAAEIEPDEDRAEDLQEHAGDLEGQADADLAAGARTYDSAERRDATAAQLSARGVSADNVATRMRADISQAEPATAATKNTRRAPKARRSRAAAQTQRTDRSR